MDKIKMAKIAGMIVIVVGIIVTVGWILDIGALKSLLPQWVTMKFTTALSFIFSGLTLYFAARFYEGRREGLPEIVLPLSALIVFLLMATNLGSALLGINTGIDSIFVKEAAGAVKSVAPGRPSIPTMADFVLIALAGAVTMMELVGTEAYLRWLGGTIAVIGAVAVLGYILGVPQLYYYFPGVNTAMAAHTAILFIICGAGFVLLGLSEKRQS